MKKQTIVQETNFSLLNSFGGNVDATLTNPYVTNSIISQVKDIKVGNVWKPAGTHPAILLLTVVSKGDKVWEGIVPSNHVILSREGVSSNGNFLPQKEVKPKPSYIWFLWVAIAIVSLCAIGYLLFKGVSLR